MGYIALARKWRPQQFDDVIGQSHITITLVNAIKQNRLGHAYLFTGPRGIGKTTLARILAKGLNCLSTEVPVPNPCDHCDSCREIIDCISLDVLEIDGASNTGVDDVRELREHVMYAPSKSRYKIYIIDEVHMLSNSAFNALLKTLEEPPAHAKFFFATTEPHKVPATVISRCQRFDLKKIARPLILERLKRIVKAEKVDSEEKALLTVATCADGSMRDAESILDQLLVYCESRICLKDVVELLGLVPREVLDGFSRAIADGELTKIITLMEDIVNQGWNIPQFLSALVRHFRDLMVISVTGKAEGLTDVPGEAVGQMLEKSRMFSGPRLMLILEELISLEKSIKYALSERVALEMTLIKLAQSRHRIYLDNLLDRLVELEKRLGASSNGINSVEGDADSPEGEIETESPSAKDTAEEPTSAEDSPESSADEPSSSAEMSIHGIWPDFIETLGRNRPVLKTYLSEGRPLEIQNGALTVCFDEEFDFHREALGSPATLTYLENLLQNKLGFPVSLKFVVGADKSPSSPLSSGKEETKPATKKKLIKQNPLIKSALDMFDGTIVDIKE